MKRNHAVVHVVGFSGVEWNKLVHAYARQEMKLPRGTGRKNKKPPVRRPLVSLMVVVSGSAASRPTTVSIYFTKSMASYQS